MNKDSVNQSKNFNLYRNQKTQNLPQIPLPLAKQSPSQQTQEQGPLWKIVVGYSIIFMSITGGILFTLGSIVYIPQLNWGFVGAGCFIIGSIEFSLCQVFNVILEPRLSPTRCLQSIAALKTLLSLIGNISFIIGSVYFIPTMPQIVGIDIFIIGSAFLWIPQVLTCWGLYLCNHYTSEFYFAFYPFRRTVVSMNLCMALACMCFIVGTVLFKNKSTQATSYYDEGVGLFIGGSLLFLLASIIALKLRKQRLTDPLWRHHRQIQSIYGII